MTVPGSAKEKKMTYEHEWETPTIVDRGKEPPHAWFTTADRYSLNGLWHFRYDADIPQAPKDFYQPAYDDSSWKLIRVPGNWEMQGFGTPIFINFKYMWTPNPPYIDIADPVGSYRRSFSVPAQWQGKRIILGFGSISGYARIFVNGKEVGMTKAAKTPAEFDVTNFVKAGSEDNLLAVQVYRYHDGSYMEDQDAWRMSGIEREVYLQAYNPLSVWDFSVQAMPVNDYQDGNLTAAVTLRNFDGQAHQGALVFRLVRLAENGREEDCVVSEQRQVRSQGEDINLSFVKAIPHVALWSAEKPNLYEMQVIMNGDTVRHLIGFREVAIKGPNLLVNGRRVFIKGVNRHDHDDTLGHAVSLATMKKDLTMMKRHNINAIRCSHYPNDPAFLNLCDRYGFYVVDEANIETHGMGSVPYFRDTILHPAYRKEWVPAHEDRIHRMFFRDRNHASVIGWSMGNECGNGKVFHDQYRWLKQHDKTRFVQFEQAWEDWNTDVVALMYPNWGRIKAYAASGKQRPFIMCEYAHSQGNSTGNFPEFWQLIRSGKNLQGGFIWDWKDQGIRRQINENTDHRTYWMYNGGMGSYVWPDDEDSGTDGIFAANITPKPAAEEVKKVYQSILFEHFDWRTKCLKIHNEYFFTPLSDFDFRWTLNRDGVQVGEGTFALATAAEHSDSVVLSLPDMKARGEYSLQVYASTRKATELVPQYFVIAKEQFLKECAERAGEPRQAAIGKPVIEDTKQKLSVRWADGRSLSIDKWSGLINSMTCHDKALLAPGSVLEPYFWRAPNDNDFGNRMPENMGLWRTAHVNRQLKSFEVKDSSGVGTMVRVVIEFKDIRQPYLLTYLIGNDGKVSVTAEMNTTGRHELPEMPRFGMRMTLAEGFEHVRYYGRGPIENYPDRKSSQFVGIYSDSVTKMYYPYIRPQQTGCHTDTRWLEVKSDKVPATLRIEGEPFTFSALHYADEDFDPGLTRKMLQTINLFARRTTHLILDNVQRGLGGDNSWGEYPHKEYRHWDGDYKMTFTIGLLQ